MGGVGATRVARSIEQTRGTPIIALTANAMPAQITACHDAGMDDYLSKPIDRDLLLRTLDKWIGQQSPSAGSNQDTRSAATKGSDLETQFGPDKARRHGA